MKSFFSLFFNFFFLKLFPPGISIGSKHATILLKCILATSVVFAVAIIRISTWNADLDVFFSTPPIASSFSFDLSLFFFSGSIFLVLDTKLLPFFLHFLSAGVITYWITAPSPSVIRLTEAVRDERVSTCRSA